MVKATFFIGQERLLLILMIVLYLRQDVDYVLMICF